MDDQKAFPEDFLFKLFQKIFESCELADEAANNMAETYTLRVALVAKETLDATPPQFPVMTPTLAKREGLSYQNILSKLAADHDSDKVSEALAISLAGTLTEIDQITRNYVGDKGRQKVKNICLEFLNKNNE